MFPCQRTNMVILARLGAHQKSQDAFNHKVWDEPLHLALSNGMRNVRCLENIRDETADWQPARLWKSAQNLVTAGELLGRRGIRAEAHCGGFCVDFGGFVGYVHCGFPAS
jgi:hypothetical protein